MLYVYVYIHKYKKNIYIYIFFSNLVEENSLKKKDGRLSYTGLLPISTGWAFFWLPFLVILRNSNPFEGGIRSPPKYEEYKFCTTHFFLISESIWGTANVTHRQTKILNVLLKGYCCFVHYDIYVKRVAIQKCINKL